ncbi:hypothetical protein QFZ60_001595 [Arthrobacter sp. B2I5]|uniref:hypothetical protein n=1 Tax=Arthrobacter sp. B2I5 TaxID=3042266 RepID=UPI002787577D|nr:hypothetical protein [Arthrobacter sp. B2I5]MDQ0825422.1 hypothetical protein [Arthrobacter sp. B2I5]
MGDSVDFILGILKNAFQGGPFNEFYNGDPDMIPAFNLPALIVTQTGDVTTPEDSASDDVVDTIVVKVVFDKKDDWSEKVDPLNMTEHKIRQVIAARDVVTGKYLPNTVKGALQSQVYGNNRINKSMSTAYGIIERPNELITAEAHLTLQVEFSVDV